jgi:hypothetical protein
LAPPASLSREDASNRHRATVSTHDKHLLERLMGLDLAAAAFWIFLAVVVGSLIWRKALYRRELLITLRVAIEKDLPLDDPRLRSLLAAGSRPRVVSRDFFLVLGVIVAAGGVCALGLAVLGPEGGPLVLIGLWAGVMAAALLLLWRLFERRAKRDGTDPK